MAAVDVPPAPRPIGHARSRSTESALPPFVGMTASNGGLPRSSGSAGIASLATPPQVVRSDADASHYSEHGPRKARRLQVDTHGLGERKSATPVSAATSAVPSAESSAHSTPASSAHSLATPAAHGFTEITLPPPVRQSKTSLGSRSRQFSDDGSSSGRGLSTDFGAETADDDLTDHEVIETDTFVWGRDPRGRRMVNQCVFPAPSRPPRAEA
jgi:hypothetical protein